MKGQNKLFFAIIIALIIGVILGGVVNKFERGTEIRINSDLIETTEKEAQVSEKIIRKEEMYSDEEINYGIGDIVTHTVYGYGVVVNLEGEFISIAFKTGTKKLLKNHKSIKKVQNGS